MIVAGTKILLGTQFVTEFSASDRHGDPHESPPTVTVIVGPPGPDAGSGFT